MEINNGSDYLMSLSFNYLFEEQNISINFPVCKEIIELKLNQVDSEVECPNCKNKFSLLHYFI